MSAAGEFFWGLRVGKIDTPLGFLTLSTYDTQHLVPYSPQLFPSSAIHRITNEVTLYFWSQYSRQDYQSEHSHIFP